MNLVPRLPRWPPCAPGLLLSDFHFEWKVEQNPRKTLPHCRSLLTLIHHLPLPQPEAGGCCSPSPRSIKKIWSVVCCSPMLRLPCVAPKPRSEADSGAMLDGYVSKGAGWYSCSTHIKSISRPICMADLWASRLVRSCNILGLPCIAHLEPRSGWMFE